MRPSATTPRSGSRVYIEGRIKTNHWEDKQFGRRDAQANGEVVSPTVE